MVNVAEFGQHKLLILFHVPRAYLNNI
jgi:hypothetical protein